MGTSFSTIQIKNQQQLSSELLIKSLCQYFHKKGLTPATAEDAEFSCRLACSGESNWVTLCYDEEYGGSLFEEVLEDAGKLAKLLKTYCVVTSVWDSDFIELHLFGSSDGQKDYLWAGRHINDAPKESGDQMKWEPLFSEGATWEQFSETLDDCYSDIFAEATFSKLAPILGMDSKNIAYDYGYWEEVEPDNPNVFVLHFRAKTVVPLLLKDGTTVLKNLTGISPILVSGNRNFISFNNVGGISKGLSVCFLGECFQNNEVEVSELVIERLKNPKTGREIARHPDDFEITTASLGKTKFSDGRLGLIANIDDFMFFEGINLEHPSNKFGNTKYDRLVLDYSVIIRFTANILSGEQHELHIAAIPHENWSEGQLMFGYVDICLTQEMLINYNKTLGRFTSQEDFAVLAKGNRNSISKATQLSAINRLRDKNVLDEISNNSDDDDIRKAVSKRLEELQQSE